MKQASRSFSAGGIVVCSDDILLVCENGNFWGFPKGRIEPGETPLQAASREIIEETGCLKFELQQELGVYRRHPFTLQNQLDTSELKEITMFLFATDTKELGDPLEGKTEGCWVAKDAVLVRLTHPQDREFFASVQSGI